MQKYIWNQYNNCDTKYSDVLKPRITLKSFLNFSDFKHQYSYKLYSFL